MANFKIDRFKYTWKGLWTTATQYIRDDVVGFSGNTYVCIKQHTSNLFYSDLENLDLVNQVPDPYWVKMTEGVVWTGDWAPDIVYNIGDIAVYKNLTYITVDEHTSTGEFLDNISKWTLYSESINFLNSWTNSRDEYSINDLVIYNGKAYICLVKHQPSAVFETDIDNWALYHSQVVYKNVWQPDTQYLADNVVTYQGKVYVSTTRHLSTSEFEADLDKWEIYYDNIYFASEWQATTKYTIDSVVIYRSKVYRCLETHISSEDFIDERQTKWEIYNEQLTWATDWVPGAIYDINFVVKYNGIIYKCNELHLSTQLFEENISKWEEYSRQIEFRSQWQSDRKYVLEDLVVLGGNVYRCLVTHVSAEDFKDDFDLGYWTLYTQQVSFEKDWTAETYYVLEDLVRYGGVVYRCVGIHTSSENFEDDSANWELYSKKSRFRNAWSELTKYAEGDIVVYNGIVYECLEIHNSAVEEQGLEEDQDKWKVYYENISYRGDYQEDVRYAKNDLVTFSGSLFRCTVGHTSQEQFDDANWTVELPGSLYKETWDASVYYGVGSVVRHGGYLYYAINNNIGVNPATVIYGAEDSTTAWAVLSKGIRFVGAWDITRAYFTGDVIVWGGNLYVCLVDNNIADSDESSILEFLDESVWELLVVGVGWKGVWKLDEIYGLGDLVKYAGDTYTCSFKHTSSISNRPIPSEDSVFWTLTIQGGPDTVLEQKGDLITFGELDGNGQGLKKFSIGGAGQVLAVNESGLTYKTWGENHRVRYVSVDGVDDPLDPNRGITKTHPWRTVRFACLQLDDDFEGTTTIDVATGRFEEVLPLVVPQRTAVVGAELRSTTIVASPAKLLDNDVEFMLDALDRLSSILPSVLSNILITKSPSNSINQITTELQLEFSIISSIQIKIQDIQRYIGFYLNELNESIDSTLLPIVVGSNLETQDILTTNTLELLLANREFLANEAVAYLREKYPTVSLSFEKIKNTIYDFVDAWKYDTVYQGNYKSLLIARHYRNNILGSKEEDMFYLRDATGVRNLTCAGLKGEFTSFDVNTYRDVSAGAYCSLDPGWGPEDQKAWINTRSPYIQNVTTIGSKCIGQKIDGALHNGGNKSMVSNDFTQVLDDGIGAWVANVGRAELVSVFTYYCDVGYLTTDGGIIRSTNGNNSYGRLGTLAVGVNLQEIPSIGTVNTRTQQAIVELALSGDFQDEIQILEWSNAGQSYTEAEAFFRGAGVDVEVEFDDFRDNAVYISQLLDVSEDPVRQDIGGTGYTFVRNNAQVHQTVNGDLTSITIAVNDRNSENDYLGMRIFITSGKGTGQYGYITGYDTINKVVSVSRESDDQPGWDHLIPGTPIANPLDNSTVYNIEPRVIYSEPGFDVGTQFLPTSQQWTAATFGEVSQIFSQVAPLGNSSDDPQDISSVVEPATFSVTIRKTKYIVSLDTGGIGYSSGDRLILPGTSVGGNTPENDIIITVLTVTEDSSNSIETFEFQGIAIPVRRYIISATNSDALAYSDNGINWTSTSLPSSGNWTNLVSGDFKFVAINSEDGVNEAAYSIDGISWSGTVLPGTENSTWTCLTHGNNKFVALSKSENLVASSEDGITWNSSTVPGPEKSWSAVAYGKRKYVSVASDDNLVAVSSDGITWTTEPMDIPELVSAENWVSIAYGNNRFVAISSIGKAVYSFDGLTWYLSRDLPLEGFTWNTIKYGQGVFFVVGNVFEDIDTTVSSYFVTSEDGIVWVEHEMASPANTSAVAFGNPYSFELDLTLGKYNPRWVAVGQNTNIVNVIRTGARAKGRVSLSSGIIRQVKLWDPGSGYQTNPSIQFISPNKTSDAAVENKLADGVLSNPTWINRGVGYRTASTRVTISGDGFADIMPVGRFVRISGLTVTPIAGSQILFDGIDRIYSIVTVRVITNHNLDPNINTVELRLTPELRIRENIQHNSVVRVRRNFSQCRITGHDYLDVGTGNFLQTNYPKLYSGNVDNAPENEVKELNGGKVFYTATDQSGNFKAGELFEVEQATGIVTLSADFFDLAGLEELRLGGVRVGGSGAVIREFSTDPLLTQDSNNIVSTQRAIARFLASRLTVGGSEVAVPRFVAGQVIVGPGEISNSVGFTVVFSTPAEFIGKTRGSILAQTMFHASFFNTEF